MKQIFSSKCRLTQERKASSSFDRRHRNVSFIYQLPFARKPGWTLPCLETGQAGGNFNAQTGAPFTVNMSTDQANIGSGPAQRPNLSADPNNGPKNPQQWFDTSVFSLPALYTFGTSPRNAVIGPGLRRVRLQNKKTFVRSEASFGSIPRRSLQPFQSPQLQHPQPNRLHRKFR